MRSSVKPSISLEMMTKMLHYEGYEEAVEGLKEFGLVFNINAGEKVTEEVARSKVLAVTDVIAAMRQQQQAEKGTKLL